MSKEERLLWLFAIIACPFAVLMMSDDVEVDA